jgi:hypothetical protein
MKKLEKILVITASIALILKSLSILGMSLFLVIALMGLSTLYLYFGFAIFNQIEFKRVFKKDSYQNIATFRIIGAIGVGCSLSIICIGILFKIQHWFGSALYLYVGLSFAFVLLIIALIRFNKSKDDFYKSILIRLISYSLVGVAVLIIHI